MLGISGALLVFSLITTPISDNSDIAKFDSGVKESGVVEVNDYIGLMPSDLVDKFCLDGYTVEITSGRLEDIDYISALDILVCGLFEPSTKRIVVEDSKNGRKSVLHEFGHYLYSLIMDDPSTFSSWIYAYKVDAGVSEYGKTNDVEGFAEAFSLYILDNDALEKSCPLTNSFLDAVFEISSFDDPK